ncbi:hypothetical protein ACSSS7_007192 [Eimeria intestinalis]
MNSGDSKTSKISEQQREDRYRRAARKAYYERHWYRLLEAIESHFPSDTHIHFSELLLFANEFINENHEEKEKEEQQQRQREEGPSQQQLGMTVAQLSQALSFLRSLKQSPDRWDLLVINPQASEFASWGPFNPYQTPAEDSPECIPLQKQVQQQLQQQQEKQAGSLKRLDQEDASSSDSSNNNHRSSTVGSCSGGGLKSSSSSSTVGSCSGGGLKSSSSSTVGSSRSLTSAQAYRLWSSGLLVRDQRPDQPDRYSSTSSLAYNAESTLPIGHLLDLAERRLSAIRKTDPLEAHRAAIATVVAAVCAPVGRGCTSRRIALATKAIEHSQLLMDEAMKTRLAGQAVLLRPRVMRERRHGFFECPHCGRKWGSDSAFDETPQSCSQCSRPVKPFKLVLPHRFPRHRQQPQQQGTYENLQQQPEKQQARRKQRGGRGAGSNGSTGSSTSSARGRGRPK